MPYRTDICRVRTARPACFDCISRVAALKIASVVCFCAVACARREPPGAESIHAEQGRLVLARAGVTRGSQVPPRTDEPRPGTLGDNLPFEPNGTRLLSTAWRTWVYTDTGPKRTRYGYLRVGAIVDARGPAIKNEGCVGGWYRINPLGFVCVGKGATLDLSHPAATQVNVRPVRGKGLPYLYAISRDSPPYRYFKLPTKKQWSWIEGGKAVTRALTWSQRVRFNGIRELLGEPAPPPDFLAQGGTLEKPYGVEQPMRLALHAGRAPPESGFAIKQTFAWEGREWGITTEHDIIALDSVEVVRPSSFAGVVLSPGEQLPVGFVKGEYLPRHELDETGNLVSSGHFGSRQGLKLTGRRRGKGYVGLTDGSWVPGHGLRVIQPRQSFPSIATGDRKWIDVSIRGQYLVAYVGTRPVFVTLVSTGRGGLSELEEAHATIRGTFMIHDKSISSTMDGEEDKSDSFALQDVPFVQYFHRGFALHGTYWHDEFGRLRSHGCINLSPADSAWLFEWTDPQVPPGWHGVINKERGTVVYVRP